MRRHLLYILAAAISVFIGCAPVNTKILYNPKTGNVAECKRDPWKNWTWQEEDVLRKCAEEYKKIGYIEVDGISDVPPQKPAKSLSERLEEIKAAYDKGLISEIEYEAKRKKIIGEY
jgi:hypothetical protein